MTNMTIDASTKNCKKNAQRHEAFMMGKPTARRNIWIPIALILGVASFPVEAQNGTTRITTPAQLENFIRDYYKNPHPELVGTAIKEVDASGLASDDNARLRLEMAFSCIFSQYSDQRNAWKTSIEALHEPAKTLLTTSIQHSPADLLSAVSTSQSKIDMNWAAYFVTGKILYINNIIGTLQYLNDRTSLIRFMAASFAEQSLAANVNTDAIVRQAIVQASATPDLYSVAQNILTKPIQQLRQDELAVIAEQKRKHIW